MFGKLVSSVFQTTPRPISWISIRCLCSKDAPFKYTMPTPWEIAGGRYGAHPFMHQVRDRFPRPKETKRVKTHGYNKRMSTLAGRKIIMSKILKGQSILAH